MVTPHLIKGLFMKMKISEFRKFLDAIDECDDVIKASTFLHLSSGLRGAIAGAIIERRANMLDQLKAAGVNVDEVV